MSNILLGNSVSQADIPMKPKTQLEMEWPKWMVSPADGSMKVFSLPEDVPEGWVTKDAYRAMQAEALEAAALKSHLYHRSAVAETHDGALDERKALFAIAKELGLKVFAGIKTDDLRAKIEEAKKAA